MRKIIIDTGNVLIDLGLKSFIKNFFSIECQTTIPNFRNIDFNNIILLTTKDFFEKNYYSVPNIPPNVFFLAENIEKILSKDQEELKNILEKIIKENDSTDRNELTKREIEILRAIALGKTTKEIAEELFISVHTVITHRKNISSKLGINSIAGLTLYAVLNNIVDINEINLDK